ncbi:MAG: hypothetical protein U0840_03095 [Gemmataceae bacterium]
MSLMLRRSLTLVLLLAISLASSAPAADEPKLKETQAVTLHLNNGTRVTGILTLVGSTSVRLRLRPGQAGTTYNATVIDAIETRDGYFRYNADAGAWEHSTEKPKAAEKPKPPEKSKNPSASLPAIKTPGASTNRPREKEGERPVLADQTVVAEGVGTTPDEARKDAIREAVRKVAGVLVVGETTVENDKLIKDKVLTYSDGVILQDSYREVERKREGDIWRIKISATVLNRKLAERLSAAGLTVRDVDGEKLAVTVLSRAEARKRAKELLEDALADLPKCMTAVAARPTDRDYLDDTEELRVNVVVGFDQKRYQAVLLRLLPVLEKICLDAGKFDYLGEMPEKRSAVTPGRVRSRPSRSVKRVKRGEGTETTIEAPVITPRQSRDFMHLKVGIEDRTSWYLWVLVSSSSNWLNTRWLTFQLDCKRGAIVEKLLATPYLVVSLIDAEGKTIASEEVGLQEERARDRRWLSDSGWMSQMAGPASRSGREAILGPNVAIAPLFFTSSYSARYAVTQYVRISVNIAPAELRRMKDIRCEIIFR